MKLAIDEKSIVVPGFRFAGTTCGVKPSGAPDLGLIVADRPATAAALFTRNRFAAAPVVLGRERLRRGRLQAIVVNSGNANACTGKAGLADARRICSAAAKSLQLSDDLVAAASTGIIGVRLPTEQLVQGVRSAAGSIAQDGLWGFARAIMTTDAFPKVASETVRVGRARITIAGIGKGAAMMAPNMATLLVFIVTDTALASAQARSILRAAGDASFNALTVDGDTSTNDSMFLLAGGAAGNAPPPAGSRALEAVARAVTSVAQQIARMVVADGEGSTKIVTIEVTGGRSERDARRVARAVGQSLLVKAAFHGSDPNWGRIACAIGYSGATVVPERVRIRIGGVEVFRHGEGIAGTESAARAAMGQSEFRVAIALGGGQARATLLASDLSHEYVELNSAYST